MKQDIFICTGELIPKDNGFCKTQMQFNIGDTISITEIENSTVSVRLCVPSTRTDLRGNRNFLLAVLWEAQWIANMWLSSISFIEAMPYSTHISSIKDSAGRVIGPSKDNLIIRHSEKLTIPIPEIVQAFDQFPELRRAIRNYAAALAAFMHRPWDVSFYLYRALECLCGYYSDRGKNDCKAWNEMHRDLGTNKEVIQTLIQKPYANNTRHGKSLDTEEWVRWYSDIPHALEYVRETLLTFLRNSATDIHQK